MPIRFQCACGKTLTAPDGSQGKKARCRDCGQILTIPAAATVAPANQPSTANEYEFSAPAPTPRPLPSAARPAPSPRRHRRRKIPHAPTPGAPTGKRTIRSFTYCLLLFALIPLIWITFQKQETIGEKIDRTLQAHHDDPQFVKNVESEIDSDDGHLKVTEQQFFQSLPNDRLDDALLPRDSHAHWLIGLLAAAAFLSFILLAFPNALKFTKGLLFAGIFTGTAGVLLLLGVQWAAFNLPSIRVRGVIGLVLLIIRLIGYSYLLADSDNGFLLSFLGYTCGVGLCEEITKTIPLLFRIKPIPGEDDPTWYSLLLWGLASGAGFGIAEGIMYSGHYYNGIDGPAIYYVRFISCVALHAIWAGANGVALYRHQSGLLNASNNWEYFFRVIYIVLVPMILHGLYDTLLKQSHDALALLVAVASFAWLAFQIERAFRSESPAQRTAYA